MYLIKEAATLLTKKFSVFFYIVFLDLGTNIGMYTLAVAAMGRKVKAVDAGFVNHAYMR